MLTKRVIPCLDVRDGRVVKGVNFVGLRDAGDPIELAAAYDRSGADEVVFLDITATSDNRATTIDLAGRAARDLRIPYTMVAAGADKVSVNSAAVRDPELITRAATAFGSQAVVVAIDAKRVGPEGFRGDGSDLGAAAIMEKLRYAEHQDAPDDQDDKAGAPDDDPVVGNHFNGDLRGPDRWEVYLAGGRVPTGIDAVAWAEEAARRGAGEILLTSMDRDGTKEGFDLALTRAVARGVPIPVIASGGVGTLEHFAEGVIEGEADAVLAASVFHFGTYTIRQVKEYMASQGIPVRLDF